MHWSFWAIGLKNAIVAVVGFEPPTTGIKSHYLHPELSAECCLLAHLSLFYGPLNFKMNLLVVRFTSPTFGIKVTLTPSAICWLRLRAILYFFLWHWTSKGNYSQCKTWTADLRILIEFSCTLSCPLTFEVHLLVHFVRFWAIGLQNSSLTIVRLYSLTLGFIVSCLIHWAIR